MEAAPGDIYGGLPTKTKLRKKLGTKPSEKEKGSEDAEEIGRWQEIVYLDASGRKVDMRAEKTGAVRRRGGGGEEDGAPGEKREEEERREVLRRRPETCRRCRVQRGTEDKGVVEQPCCRFLNDTPISVNRSGARV